ncbi:nitrous oxide reductase family maturation protein NosD [Nonomuraea sp. NPDC050783]|uniref:right-handed parallel beta-helix repeat-containing protein n=1 Tax=Nonomuraea sp. NPDC050783 TaxID=3154634 RepID=UPI003466D62A
MALRSIAAVALPGILLTSLTLAVGETASAAGLIKDTDYPIPAGAVFVSPGGSDTAAGTEAQPLRTLAAGIARISSGGTVVMRAGNYRESIAGVNKRITVQPYPHEKVWIKGTDVVSGWTADGAAWRTTTWRSPFCQDCYPAQAINPAYPLAGKPDQAFRDGRPLRQVATRAEVGAGTFYVDPSSKVLYVGDDPAGATMELSTRWRAMLLNAGAAGSVIRGLGFSEYSPHWNEDQLAMLVDAAPNSVIENNVFVRSATRALGIYAAGIRVEGNTVDDNGGSGGAVNRADGAVFRGNTFDRNNNQHFAVTTCGSYCTMAGMKVAHTKDVVVEQNSFAGNDGTGFWCDLGCTNGQITGNTVTGNTNNGIFWEVSSVATIQGNTISGNTRGVKIAGSDRTTVTGNTFTGNATHLGVYDDARLPSSDSYSAGLGLTWDTAQTVLTGNDFAGATSLLMDTNRTTQVAAPAMFGTVGGNRVTGVQTVNWCPSGCTSYATLAAFRAATGIDFGTVG